MKHDQKPMTNMQALIEAVHRVRPPVLQGMALDRVLAINRSLDSVQIALAASLERMQQLKLQAKEMSSSHKIQIS